MICQNCGKCCFDTEMELSRLDIKRIEKLNPWGLKEKDFTRKDGGYHLLKNIDGHCIFLDPETLLCKIYDYRPKGCEFYPLIFDLKRNRCKLDDLCPHKEMFFKNKKEVYKKCNELRVFIKKELLPGLK